MLRLSVAAGCLSVALGSAATLLPHTSDQGLVPAVHAAATNCTAIKSATDADLIAALGWLCGAGGVNCAAINPGGSHFDPNDAVHHADYAFTEYYHTNEKNGYDTCFFGGNAFVDPPPVGHWLFIQGGKIDYPYPTAKEGVGLWDTIKGGTERTYSSETFSGKMDTAAYASSIFSLWVAVRANTRNTHPPTLAPTS
jgi:hypothetical protein